MLKVGNRKQKRVRQTRRGKKVQHAINSGTFTSAAPFIESALEIAEASREEFAHLEKPAKEILCVLWKGLDRDQLSEAENAIHEGLIHFSQAGVSPSLLALIPQASEFWCYFSKNTELVFELCARVARWRSLKGGDTRNQLLRFMLLNPAILTKDGLASVHRNINGLVKVATTDEILDAFTEVTKRGHPNLPNPVTAQVIADIRHRKLRDRGYRNSLEKRSKALGINCST